MKEILKVDLRIARQQSALSNADVAKLLGISKSRLSKLENGFARPKTSEIIGLALIYGKTIDSLFRLTSNRLTDKLKRNLAELDFEHDPDKYASKKRVDTLNALVGRLRALAAGEDE